MTETQATSGAAGTSTNPVDKETKGGPPGGHPAVGRAAVPANEPASPKSTPQKPDQSAAASPGDSGGAGAGGSSQAESGGSKPADSGRPGPAAAAASAFGDQDSAGRNPEDSAGRQPESRGAEESSGKGDEPALSSRPHSSPDGGPGAAGGAPGSRTPLAGATVRYTRAPGMAPPPDGPPGDGRATGSERPGAPATVSASASVPLRASAVTLAPLPDAPAVPLSTRPGGVGSGRPGGATLRSGRNLGAARVAEAVRGARSVSSAAAARGPRRARLVLKRVDPWSVMKFSFAVSLVLFIVTIVATSVLYLALDAMGVFDSVNASLGDLLSSAASSDSGGGSFKITAGGVIGTAALLGLINVVLFTALATLGAFIYNVCADLVGGVEMTLSERE